jgi:hypothetical protein
MEKNLKNKISKHNLEFKQEIKNWLDRNDCMIMNKIGNNQTNDFLHFIYDYASIEFIHDDFKRRSRVKTNIPVYERCCGLCLNGERCTRKKLGESEYCGTHIKGIPYGKVKDSPTEPKIKTEIWLEEICGIHQYIDKDGNIYSTQDILDNSIKTPRIISQWKKNDKGEYIVE